MPKNEGLDAGAREFPVSGARRPRVGSAFPTENGPEGSLILRTLGGSPLDPSDFCGHDSGALKHKVWGTTCPARAELTAPTGTKLKRQRHQGFVTMRDASSIPGSCENDGPTSLGTSGRHLPNRKTPYKPALIYAAHGDTRRRPSCNAVGRLLESATWREMEHQETNFTAG